LTGLVLVAVALAIEARCSNCGRAATDALPFPRFSPVCFARGNSRHVANDGAPSRIGGPLRSVHHTEITHTYPCSSVFICGVPILAVRPLATRAPQTGALPLVIVAWRAHG